MAWETRNGRGRYYYRAERHGGRVVKVYRGRGPAADDEARQDAEAKASRAADQAAARSLHDELATLEGRTSEVDRGCDLLAEAALLAAGFYLHHGTWRRRGHRSDDDGSGDKD